MHRLLHSARLAAALLGCALGGATTTHAQKLDPALERWSVPAASERAEKLRRTEIAGLRARLAKARTLDVAFWDDVRRLERLGPQGFRVAVVQHPGGRMVYTYRKLGELAVADEHVVLGPYDLVVAQQAFLRGEGPASATFAAVPAIRDYWWSNGIVPFEIDSGLERRAREEIRAAIDTYNEKTPLRLRERTNESTYVRYVKQLECCGPFGHLASMTGHPGMRPGVNEVKIQTVESDGTLRPREHLRFSAVHETGHAIGLFHEHNRKDRDDFVDIDEDCLDFFYSISGNFSINDASEAVGPYDFNSVMHYPTKRGQKGPPWDRRDCFTMVKRPEHRAPNDSTGEIFSNLALSTHDINALHHVYGRPGVTPAAGDSYGFALLSHDFDRDGYEDLAVGAPGRSQGSGAVFLYKGTASGNVLWKVLTPEQTQAGQRFGSALAAGDFDGDGVQDLAVGAPLANVEGKHGAGKVFIFRIRGNREREQTEVLTKPSGDGTIETQDRFGAALLAGRFFEPQLEAGRPPRAQLAIGAPGARDGVRGRTGRAWVVNNDPGTRWRAVRLQNSAAEKFGQFGFAFTILRTAFVSGNDSLVVAAPGVTLGGCGAPRVHTTRIVGTVLETVRELTEPDAPVPVFCPQDDTLSDDTDAVPMVWDATFGARITSGDFDGDGRADLAVAAAPSVLVFRGQADGSYANATRLRRSDFAESGPDYSFGSAVIAADLDEDGRHDLLIGSPLTSLEAMPGVGKVYAYRGCAPFAGLAPLPGELVPSVRPPFNADRIVNLCRGGMRRWFRLTQEDAQVLPSPFGGASTTLHVAANAANDRFGFALAARRASPRERPLFYVTGVDKALHGTARSGAVFLAAPAFVPGDPPYRTTAGWNPAFETRFVRD